VGNNQKPKNSNEIKEVLNEEIKDSLCKCFTGRLSRMINCLSGFDPRVQVKISESETSMQMTLKDNIWK